MNGWNVRLERVAHAPPGRSPASAAIAKSPQPADLGRAAGRVRHRTPHRSGGQRKRERVSKEQLIKVTEAADAAFGGFDFSAHEGKGVRVFIQGFG